MRRRTTAIRLPLLIWKPVCRGGWLWTVFVLCRCVINAIFSQLEEAYGTLDACHSNDEMDDNDENDMHGNLPTEQSTSTGANKPASPSSSSRLLETKVLSDGAVDLGDEVTRLDRKSVV